MLVGLIHQHSKVDISSDAKFSVLVLKLVLIGALEKTLGVINDHLYLNNVIATLKVISRGEFVSRLKKIIQLVVR